MPMVGEKVVLTYAGEGQAASTIPAGIVRATEVHEDVVMAIGRLFRGD